VRCNGGGEGVWCGGVCGGSAGARWRGNFKRREESEEAKGRLEARSGRVEGGAGRDARPEGCFLLFVFAFPVKRRRRGCCCL
jgi:hypothetical protein